MIAQGTILVEQGTLLPETMRLETATHSSGWATVAINLDSRQIEKKLETAGWTFFFMAGEIKSSGFGFNDQNRTDAAVQRLIANAKTQKCNCLEIDGVTAHSFLGLPYVSVTAHSRHIQQGLTFGVNER